MTLYLIVIVTVTVLLFAVSSECRYCNRPLLNRSKLCRRCRNAFRP